MEQDLNLDQLRRQWREADNIIGELGDKAVAKLSTRINRVSYCDRLKRQASMTVCCGVLGGMFWCPLLYFMFEFPLWLLGVCVGYFVLMSALNFGDLRRIRRLDFGVLSAREALELIYEIERKRRRLQLIGVPLAVGVVGALLCFFANVSAYLLTGGLVGAVIGLVIGLIMDRRGRSLIKKMKQSLQEELSYESCS